MFGNCWGLVFEVFLKMPILPDVVWDKFDLHDGPVVPRSGEVIEVPYRDLALGQVFRGRFCAKIIKRLEVDEQGTFLSVRAVGRAARVLWSVASPRIRARFISARGSPRGARPSLWAGLVLFTSVASGSFCSSCQQLAPSEGVPVVDFTCFRRTSHGLWVSYILRCARGFRQSH